MALKSTQSLLVDASLLICWSTITNNCIQQCHSLNGVHDNHLRLIISKSVGGQLMLFFRSSQSD
jgi:hypothetical protein